MNIKKDEKILLLRFSNYKTFDFVIEHQSEIKAHGFVWMLKAGKMIPRARLEELFYKPNVMILKAPKVSGGKYYLAEVVSAFNGHPKEEMLFPGYYGKMLNDLNLWTFNSLEGTWFCVRSIDALSDETVSHLHLVSNNKQVEDVLGSTRSATVYVYSDITLVST